MQSKMTTKWDVIERVASSPDVNMQIDYELLQESRRPTLHLYDWDCLSGTYGYFSKLSDHLNLKALGKHQITMARRPTGGGILFHLTDLAFSVIIPSSCSVYSLNTLENYRFINEIVGQALKEYIGNKAQYLLLEQELPCQVQEAVHFCMAKPTKYDVVLNGQKVGGAAQRRTKQGFLHQGTISLAPPNRELLEELLLGGKPLVEEMSKLSWALLPNNWTQKELKKTRLELRKQLIKTFKKVEIGSKHAECIS